MAQMPSKACRSDGSSQHSGDLVAEDVVQADGGPAVLESADGGVAASNRDDSASVREKNVSSPPCLQGSIGLTPGARTTTKKESRCLSLTKLPFSVQIPAHVPK